MAKTKRSGVSDAKAQDLSSVKDGGVLRSSQTSNAKSKDLAKSVATKAMDDKKGKKASKKSKKESTPETSSDESESDEEMSDAESGSGTSSDAESESDDSDSAAEESISEADVGAKEKPHINGQAKIDISSETLQGDADTSESSASSDSSNEESSEDEEATPKTSKVAGPEKAMNGAVKKDQAREVRSSRTQCLRLVQI